MAKSDKPARKPSKTLDDLLAEQYSDPKLRQRVKEDVEARGTEKAIVKGELKLPHPQDAEAHFRKLDAASQEEDE